ncbi:hypothetical protein D3C76_837850 [compost metagenome]
MQHLEHHLGRADFLDNQGENSVVIDAITIHHSHNRGRSTGHVSAERSVTFTEIQNGGHQKLARQLPT